MDTILSSELGEQPVKIKVIGIGGAGCNAVDRIRMDGTFPDVELAAVNTDAQALASSPVDEKLMIGRKVCRGLSCAGDPELGRKAAVADRDNLKSLISGADLVFLLAGLGGGTGSGTAPVVAKIAAEQEALVIAFVTKPFSMEGEKRQQIAEEALVSLREHCAAVVPVPNDVLLQHMDETATVLDAFQQADSWISRGIRSICSILFRTGLINLDFASLRQAFCRNGGKTVFGLGRGEGDDALQEALTDLELCPLVHTPDFARKADRLLVNIIGGADLGMSRVTTIMERVSKRFCSGDQIALGAIIDEACQGRIEICVLGTTELDVQSRKSDCADTISETGSGKRQKRKVHASKLSERDASLPQEEFTFVNLDEQRGYFEKTSRNIFEGQDLDVPTYLRRGIRINVND